MRQPCSRGPPLSPPRCEVHQSPTSKASAPPNGDLCREMASTPPLVRAFHCPPLARSRRVLATPHRVFQLQERARSFFAPPESCDPAFPEGGGGALSTQRVRRPIRLFPPPARAPHVLSSNPELEEN